MANKKLLAKINRLENALRLIACQNDPFELDKKLVPEAIQALNNPAKFAADFLKKELK